jgi:hypothetical protein
MLPRAHIAFIAEEFAAGRYDWLTTGYCYPLPLYLNASLMVASCGTEAVEFFESLHALLQGRNLGPLEGQLVLVDAPQNNRFRMLMNWSCASPSGRVPIMQTSCFNRGTWTAHITEMVHIELQDSSISQRLKAAA